MKIIEKIKFKDSVFIPLSGLMFGNSLALSLHLSHIRMILFKICLPSCKGDFTMIMSGNYELMFVSIPRSNYRLSYMQISLRLQGMGEDFSTNLGLI